MNPVRFLRVAVVFAELVVVREGARHDEARVRCVAFRLMRVVTDDGKVLAHG